MDLTERIGQAAIGEDAKVYVLHALAGPDQLAEILGGDAQAAPPPAAHTGLPTVHLTRLTVEGFRGIGPPATLDLAAGPGLTLIIGRNGSGKSSFSEALEVLLTGDSQRWADRHRAWGKGWRNLHRPHPTAITATVAIEGRGEVTITRRWDDGAALADATTDTGALGWDHALRAYRPFLSYNELGSMFESKPSELYDALWSILGLEPLEHARKALADQRLTRERESKTLKAELAALLDQLAAVDDPRASDVRDALSGRRPDLERARKSLVTDDAPDTGRLRRVLAVELPPADAVAAAARDLRGAAARVAALRDTGTERARTTVRLLETALHLCDDETCPTCGAALDRGWRGQTQLHIERLQDEARQADEAAAAVQGAVRAAKALVQPPPRDVDLPEWHAWAAAPDDPDALAAHIEDAHTPLVAAVGQLKASAERELDEREEAWRPLAGRVAVWIDRAGAAATQEPVTKDLKAAEGWLKETTDELRRERFAPLKDGAAEIWSLLRQESNVELAGIELKGSSTSRTVRMDVTVDGVEGAALGVMSQGELNALALSMFLPRATLDDSPFRFVVIDDPVQAMDPAKVDGLARVLEGAARTRQVIVLTHDDRLPEAVRRLQIAAHIKELRRQPGSVVTLRDAHDPVSRHLGDAFTVVRTERMDDRVKAQVVPGILRMAVEAACIEVVRKRRLARGDRYTDVEDLLLSCKRLTEFAALALHDDVAKTDQVMPALDRRSVADTFKTLNKGAHEGASGLDKLQRDTEALVRVIRKL